MLDRRSVAVAPFLLVAVLSSLPSSVISQRFGGGHGGKKKSDAVVGPTPIQQTDVELKCHSDFKLVGDQCQRVVIQPAMVVCEVGEAMGPYDCVQTTPLTYQCPPGYQEVNNGKRLHGGDGGLKEGGRMECIRVDVLPPVASCLNGIPTPEGICVREVISEPELVCPLDDTQKRRRKKDDFEGCFEYNTVPAVLLCPSGTVLQSAGCIAEENYPCLAHHHGVGGKHHSQGNHPGGAIVAPVVASGGHHQADGGMHHSQGNHPGGAIVAPVVASGGHHQADGGMHHSQGNHPGGAIVAPVVATGGHHQADGGMHHSQGNHPGGAIVAPVVATGGHHQADGGMHHSQGSHQGGAIDDPFVAHNQGNHQGEAIVAPVDVSGGHHQADGGMHHSQGSHQGGAIDDPLVAQSQRNHQGEAIDDPVVVSGGHHQADGGQHDQAGGGQHLQADGGQYPQADGGQYPQADGGQYPQADGGQYPQADGGQYPLADGGQYPQADGGQHPLADGGQYPLADGGQHPLADGGQHPLADGGQHPQADGGQLYQADGGQLHSEGNYQVEATVAPFVRSGGQGRSQRSSSRGRVRFLFSPSLRGKKRQLGRRKNDEVMMGEPGAVILNRMCSKVVYREPILTCPPGAVEHESAGIRSIKDKEEFGCYMPVPLPLQPICHDGGFVGENRMCVHTIEEDVQLNCPPGFGRCGDDKRSKKLDGDNRCCSVAMADPVPMCPIGFVFEEPHGCIMYTPAGWICPEDFVLEEKSCKAIEIIPAMRIFKVTMCDGMKCVQEG